MNSAEIAGERLVALFILGLLLLSPPFVLIFDTPSEVAGIPVLYLYLFIAWAALIALLAFATEFSKTGQEDNIDPVVQMPGQESQDSGDTN
jgi:hypothetical protein